MNSGRFDSENFQEADGNKAFYSIMHGLIWFSVVDIHTKSKAFYIMPFKIQSQGFHSRNCTQQTLFLL